MTDIRDQVVEHLRFYAELGVAGSSSDRRWSRRPDAASPEDRTSDASTRTWEGEAQPLRVFGRDALAAIQTELGVDCTRCKLHRMGRRQVVFGVGNPDADLMFVGEAPGADEDIQGI